ncbi:nucleotidyltransferase family protein [Dechloromonas denitrificans]|nr:nucleotidyltransferase family protein [Dechloromonas denitrificans]
MDAVRAIEVSRRRMAVVVAGDGLLLGTLTDGDVRRHLLAGGGLEACVSDAMNPSPIFAEEGFADGYMKDLMRRGNVIALPLVDKNHKFLRLIHLMDLEQGEMQSRSTPGFTFAVIMAGGEGTRLRPLTNSIPKPMVEVGGLPLLARQLQRLADVRISRVYLSVNYLSHIIEEYFGDGQDFGLEICYLREQEKLGTAGALSLLPEQPDGPIVVMNGDILTTFDFDSFYAFHSAHGAKITVAAIDHKVHIPYGVIRTAGPFVTEIVEKPSERFLCNAGIYAVSPEVLNRLPGVQHNNMTDVIDTCLRSELPVAVFPVHEYWSDIGTPSDLEKARAYFSKTEMLG